MKKAYILLFAALAWNSAKAQDSNEFYFTDAAIMPGETANVELCIKNSATNLTCIEAEIKLPEGISVVCDEDGNPQASLRYGRATRHELLANVLDNGNLKLLVSSVDGVTVNGNKGPLLFFTVQADNSAPVGEYAVETVGESLLVDTAADAYYSVGVTGYFLITDDPTSVASLRSETTDDAPVYNLAGQRVGKAKNGIFIKGGKKELHR